MCSEVGCQFLPPLGGGKHAPAVLHVHRKKHTLYSIPNDMGVVLRPTSPSRERVCTLHISLVPVEYNSMAATILPT